MHLVALINRLRPLVGAALLATALTGIAYAQEASPAPAADEAAGLAFPIPELGDCADMGTCMSYCEDPVNHASCVTYAQEKGFYEDDPTLAPTDDLLTAAQEELGCDSKESCQAFCADAANQTACHDFAADHAIPGGYVVDPEKEAILAAAETALGCDSYAGCLDFCADPANAAQCTSFADQVGLQGGEET